MSSRAKDERTRRDTIEDMRRSDKAAERRKSVLVIGIASLIAIALIAIAAVPLVQKARNNPAKKNPSAFGVSQAAAGCDPVTDDKAVEATHIGPGTGGATEGLLKVTYKTVPPSSGDHFLAPDFSGRHFFTAKDTPPLETLVHNLEHGYTIVWYDKTVKGDQLKALKDLAVRIPLLEAAGPGNKFIVAALDDARGTMPEGKHIAASHWSAQSADKKTWFGHRQLCAQVSGEQIAAFVKKYPATDAPEANTP